MGREGVLCSDSLFKCVWPLLQVLNYPIPSWAVSGTDFMPGTCAIGALQMMALVTVSTGTKLGHLTAQPHRLLFSWLSSAMVLEDVVTPAGSAWASSWRRSCGLQTGVCWVGSQPGGARGSTGSRLLGPSQPLVTLLGVQHVSQTIL